MDNPIINILTNKMIESAKNNGFTHEDTVKYSQTLDEYIIFFQRKLFISSPEIKQAKVFQGAFLNIFQTMKENGIDGSSVIDKDDFDNLTNNQEWKSLDKLKLLLARIKSKWGQEILIEIGSNVPNHCLFPSIETAEDCLKLLNDAYIQNHTSHTIGEYKYFQASQKEIYILCNTSAYPYEFNFGLLNGLVKKYNSAASITGLSDENGGEFRIKLL